MAFFCISISDIQLSKKKKMHFFVSVYEAEFYAAVPSPHTKKVETKQILINSGAKKRLLL